MAETYVLVHGAWHAAWCWAAVINQLDKRGDHAFAVDLPGHGTNYFDRAKVTLDVYVDSVAKFIEDRGLRDVVLAGHSMGGLVISGVTGRIPKRIKRVVFVTAFVMKDGETPLEPTDNVKALIDAANSRYDKSIPIDTMAEQFRANFMQDGSKALQDFVLSALSPQPIAPLINPVAMKEFHRAGVPQSYLVCENDKVLTPGGNWHPYYSSRLDHPTIRTVKSGHEVMFTKPIECADALYELARE